jgi:hypothetical protein
MPKFSRFKPVGRLANGLEPLRVLAEVAVPLRFTMPDGTSNATWSLTLLASLIWLRAAA